MAINIEEIMEELRSWMNTELLNYLNPLMDVVNHIDSNVNKLIVATGGRPMRLSEEEKEPKPKEPEDPKPEE